jgi:hypothetical protein
MLDKCPATVIGLRDRALIAFGFASACRRTELGALQVSDLLATVDGYRVTIRRSKGDQEGEGQEVAVPRGCRIEPVKAVEAWLAAAKITDGPLFRRVVRGGHIQAAGLDGQSMRRSSNTTPAGPGWIRLCSAATACEAGSCRRRPTPAHRL